MNAGTRVPTDLRWLGRLTLLGCLGSLGACGGAVTKDGGQGNPAPSLGTGGDGVAICALALGVGGTAGAGTDGQSGDAGQLNSGEPVDDRPPRPWDLPFPLGQPGCGRNTEPLCEKNQGGFGALNVWADERGVFVLFEADCVPPNLDSGGNCVPGKDGVSLKLNDGTGWQTVYQVAPGSQSTGHMYLQAGFPAGPLVLTGYLDGQHGVVFVDGGVATLSTQLSSAWPVFVAGSDLAYAVTGSGLLRYQGGGWSPVVTAVPTDVLSNIATLWADDQTVVLAGSNQAIYMKTAGSPDFVLLPGVPAGTYVESMWGFGPRDLWVGDFHGAQLMHYDGNGWQVYPSGAPDPTRCGILKLWGANGQVYFVTQTEVGRWNGQAAEVLLTLPSDGSLGVTDLWGRSSSEVFVTVHNYNLDQFACGGEFILWFDGSQFHQI